MNISSLINKPQQEPLKAEKLHSLSELLGHKKPLFFELTYVIKSHLNSSMPIQNLQDLAQRIEAFRATLKDPVIEAEFKKWSNHSIKFIMNQFPNAECYAVSEAISNSGDAQSQNEALKGIPSEQCPIVVTVDGSQGIMRVHDRGNGFSFEEDPKVGNSSLAQLVIAGLTSKRKKTTAESIGQFGQGIFSIFFYLMYNKLSRFNSPQDAKNAKLDPDRVSFLSYDGYHSPIEIEVSNEEGELYVDIKDAIKPEKGTLLTIESALVSKVHEKVCKFLTEKFSHYQKYPIDLNGTWINSFKGISEIPFKGGVLYFNEPFTLTPKGKIDFYEKGVFILAYQLEKGFIPEGIGINFDSLPLSSDRASINFNHPSVEDLFFQLINTLIANQELSLTHKAAFLNSLQPVLKKESFKACLGLIKDFVKACHSFPDKKSVRALNIKDAIYFHLDYIEALPIEPIYVQAELMIIPVEANSNLPFVVFLLNTQHIVLINQRLFDMGNRLVCQFNFEWLKSMLTKKDIKLPLNMAVLMDFFFPVHQEKTTGINFLAIEREDMDEDDELTTIAEIISLLIDPPAFISSLTIEVIKTCLEMDPQFTTRQALFVKTLHFLSSADLEILGNRRSLIRPLGEFVCNLLKLDGFQTAHALKALSYVCEYVTTCEEVTGVYYLEFMRESCSALHNLFGYWEEEDFDFLPLHKHFLKINKLVEIAGKGDPEVIGRFFQTAAELELEELDRSMLLLEKLSNLRHRFMVLPALVVLRDLSSLVHLPEDQLVAFIEVLPYRELYEENLKLDNTDQKLITHIATLPNVPTYVKKGWVKIYYRFKIWGRLHNINFNLKELTKVFLGVEFVKNIPEKAFDNYLKELIHNFRNIDEQFLTALKDLREIFQTALQDAPHTEEMTQDEKLSFLKNLLKSNCDDDDNLRLKIDNLSDQALNSFFMQGDELLNFHFEEWNRRNLISPQARPLLIAALLPKKTAFKQLDFPFPTIGKEARPLHDFPFVSNWCGSPEAALNRIKTAMKQNEAEEFSWLIEIVKNALQASASEVNMYFYVDGESVVFSTYDNGKGMDRTSMEAFVNPESSTKTTETLDVEKDSNFGRGAFTAFKHCDEMAARSYREGHPLQECLLQRQGDILIVELKEGLPQGSPVGTQILLRKKVVDPKTYFVKLKTAIYDLNNVQGMTLKFNDQKVNGIANHQDIKAEETYFVGKTPHTLLACLGAGNNGIYVKEMRMSDIPKDYLEHLPKVLKNFIKNSGLQFSVFLPEIQQVMNRNHFTDKDSVLIPIQRAVLMIAIKHFLKNLLEDKSAWGKLSGDVLFDFKQFKQPLNERQMRIKAFFETNDWNQLDDPKLGKSFSNLLHQIKLINEPKLSKAEKQLALILEQISSEDECIFMLMHLPLIENGLSIMDIRILIAQELEKVNLLTNFGDYNNATLNASEEVFLQSLKVCFKNVNKAINNEAYTLIINKFEKQIAERLQVRKAQLQLKIEADPEFDQFLVEFFTQVSERLLSKQIRVIIETELNGANASNTVNTNIMNFNRLGENYKTFRKFYHEYCKGDDKQKIIQAHLPLFVKTLETLTHEVAHMIEGSKHKATHDFRFYDLMFKLMLKMVVADEQHSFIGVIDELLSQNEQLHKNKS